MTTEKLSGIIIPLVTPFKNDEKISREGLRDLVRYMVSQDPDYLMPTALTGEGPMLDVSETLSVWEEVFAAAEGKINVIPAIISTRTKTAILLAQEAHKMGAAAIMVAPIVPELYAGRSESDVYGFHADVAAATPLPLILFNYPSLTGVDLTPQFVARLAQIDTVSYIKESTGDSTRVHAIQRLCGSDIKVICGNPVAALESFALGSDAWITGIMNVAPKSSKELLRAVVDRQDLEAGRRIYYEQLLPLVDAIAATNNPMGVIKAGLRLRGLDVGIPRLPGTDLSASGIDDLNEHVKKILAYEDKIRTAA